jgi:hypothetical protein
MSFEESLHQARKARLQRFAARAVAQTDPAQAAPPRGASSRAAPWRAAHNPLDRDYERAWACELLGLPDGPPPRPLRVDDIVRATAHHFGVDRDAVLARDRGRTLARARHVAMYLARRLTTQSLADIGRRFGARDHTLALYAVRRIERLIADDRRLSESIVRIGAALGCSLRESGESPQRRPEEAV